MPWYLDSDSDGYGVSDDSEFSCSPSIGRVQLDGDCDDTENGSSINPGATEVCDDLDVDEDCDGKVDDEDSSLDQTTTNIFYLDQDKDGYGINFTATSCDALDGYADNNDDCNDTNDEINPGKLEICDEFNLDEDCNGFADDEDTGENFDVSLTGTQYFIDVDEDGYGDPESYEYKCETLDGYVLNNEDCDDSSSVKNQDDADEDGYTTCENDCNDKDNKTFPGSAEFDSSTHCLSDKDNDGYGQVIDCYVIEYDAPPDPNNDWYGWHGVSVYSNGQHYQSTYENGPRSFEICNLPDGDFYIHQYCFIKEGQNCNLYSASIYDDAGNLLGISGDNTPVYYPDEYWAPAYLNIFYYGSKSSVSTDCDDLDYGLQSIDNDNDCDNFKTDDDCDDSNENINPNTNEIWYDGVDGNCDGLNDYDKDQDGFVEDEYTIPSELDGGDCNDDDNSINPNALETWYDGVDQDCQGDNDFDRDGDGFESDEYGGDDCNDLNNEINPGKDETMYDGIDVNCVDDPNDEYDFDGDGFVPSDYATVSGLPGGDCDDIDPGINPSVLDETVDGIDNDCDGTDGVDADGDGFASQEAGGDDCDDNDAELGSILTDADCDGIPDNCTFGDCDNSIELSSEVSIDFVNIPYKNGKYFLDEGEEALSVIDLNYGFEMMTTEVTQGMFQELMGDLVTSSFYDPYGPLGPNTPNRPQDSVTWSQAVAFANALSSYNGLDLCYTCDQTANIMPCVETVDFETSVLCEGYTLPSVWEWI